MLILVVIFSLACSKLSVFVGEDKRVWMETKQARMRGWSAKWLDEAVFN